MDLFAESAVSLANAELELNAHWLDKQTADQWLRSLEEQTPWQQPSLMIYGKVHVVPRLVAWYGDKEASYRYSGYTHQPLLWTPLLLEIRRQVERATGQVFNAVLLNYYRNGQDSMGWHSDDEMELGDNPVIASVNLGATRRFDLRRKGLNRIEHSILLPHGSLLVMRGATQHHWQHQVAKTRSCDEPRLNMTFRLVSLNTA